MRINDIEVSPVIDVIGRSKPTELFLGTAEVDWLPHRALLDHDGMLESAIGGFLIRGCGDRLILVDAGLGGHPSVGGFAKLPPERQLLANLAALGVRADDITDVVFTHLHTDHTGWATKKGEVVFGSATYWCGAPDWEHFIGHDEGTTKKLSPITERLQTWDAVRTLYPGVDVLPAPGHTPGSTIIVLSSGAQRAMLVGDVIHCAAELMEPEWDGIADVDPKLAKQAKEDLAREIEDGHTLVAGAHFPQMQFGRLLVAEGRRHWTFEGR